eukprot:JP440958.1.p3 GENE.JP440958.1~~JP440958.1.p3  ORF type:complete len:70 (-),score=20.22 JP440958.1:117-326(-)
MGNALHCLESANCCKLSHSSRWGHCQHHNAHFGKRANFECPHGMFMAGVYRTKTDNLGGIPYFKCCTPQ